MSKKLTVIVSTGRELTPKERRGFKKDHPGYRLCFMLRYPNFPLWFSISSLLVVIASILIAPIIHINL